LGAEETQKIIRKLLADHGEARRHISKLKDDFQNQKEIDYSEFSSLMRDHQNTENDVLYPKLDRDLEESEKDFILKKISQMN
jgi:hemerythrin-like domain-containing protein